jgi:hypothetical protein
MRKPSIRTCKLIFKNLIFCKQSNRNAHNRQSEIKQDWILVGGWVNKTRTFLTYCEYFEKPFVHGRKKLRQNHVSTHNKVIHLYFTTLFVTTNKLVSRTQIKILEKCSFVMFSVRRILHFFTVLVHDSTNFFAKMAYLLLLLKP